MNQVASPVHHHLHDLYSELDASRSTVRALIEAEKSTFFGRTLSQIERMISEVFFPFEFVVYSDENTESLTAMPAGYAWRVIGQLGDIRIFRCNETGQEISLSIEQAIAGFALVPDRLPDAYFAEIDLTPTELETKYSVGTKEHPFLPNYQWVQAVRSQRTQLGYWHWVQAEMSALYYNVRR